MNAHFDELAHGHIWVNQPSIYLIQADVVMYTGGRGNDYDLIYMELVRIFLSTVCHVPAFKCAVCGAKTFE